MKKKKKAEREAAGVGGFYAKKFLGMGGAGWLGWGARHPGAVSSRTVAPAAWWGQTAESLVAGHRGGLGGSTIS